jgi:hypothetical protein
MKKEIGLVLTWPSRGHCRPSPPGQAHPEGGNRTFRRGTPEGAEGQAGSQGGDELISLDLKDADLRDVLRTFASLERINASRSTRRFGARSRSG